jgi:predicted secreted protein
MNFKISHKTRTKTCIKTSIFAIKLIAIQAIITPATALFAQNLQESNSFRPLQNVVQLSANAAVDAPQDLLAITMATTRESTDANTVQTQLKTALDTALTEAKKNAARGQLDVRTGNFSLYPRYSKDGKINGWQGSTELVLEGRDFAKISAAAGKIQTLTVANVAFSLSREKRNQVENEAQQIAIERFRSKAAEIAKSFGQSSYTLREVAVNAGDQGFSPRPNFRADKVSSFAASDASVPVEAGKSIVTVTVSGSVQLR